MRQYIIRLTDHLINKNGYRQVFQSIRGDRDDMIARDEMIRHVKLDLLAGDVRGMSPGKLGEIMCSLDIGDVMASKDELFRYVGVHFSGDGVNFRGDCEELLRELVSVCLAYAITDLIIEQDIGEELARRQRGASGV